VGFKLILLRAGLSMLRLCFYLLLGSTCALESRPFMRVDPEQNVYKDSAGRARFFHGVNYVRKSAPFIPLIGPSGEDSMNSTDAQELVKQGMNAVRLGVMWTGLMPSSSAKDDINTTYLGLAEDIVDLLWSHGIYTVVDLHQDVLSPYICGEGAPLWVNTSFPGALPFPLPLGFKPMTYKPDGLPKCDTWQPVGWSSYYFADATGKSFQAMYSDNTPQKLGTAVETYWTAVAAKFAHHPGVLGYELLNEPWMGDHVKNPDWIISPHKADAVNLFPFYQRLHKAIREVDDQHIIFYSGVELSNRFMQHTSFSVGPGGHEFDDRQSFVFHDYCVFGTDGPGPPAGLPRVLCNGTDQTTVKVRAQDSRRLQTALMMTEFGAVGATPDGIEETKVVTNDADATVPPTSWLYWDWTPGKGPGRNSTHWNVVSRSYAQAVAGYMISQHFDFDSAVFALNFTTNTSVTADTSVYLWAEHYYPAGVDVQVTPPGAVVAQIAPHGITLHNVQNHVPVAVVVTPKRKS